MLLFSDRKKENKLIGERIPRKLLSLIVHDLYLYLTTFLNSSVKIRYCRYGRRERFVSRSQEFLFKRSCGGEIGGKNTLALTG